MNDAVNEGKNALLRALEELDNAKDDLGDEPQRIDLVVIYSVGVDKGNGEWHEVRGWSSTAGPKWVHAAMCQRAADALKTTDLAVDDEDEDEEYEE